MAANKTSKWMSWAKLFAIYSGILAALVIFVIFQNVFIPLIIAMIFVYLLNPLADWFESFGIRRTLAVILIFAGSFVLVLGFIFFFQSQITGEFNTLKRQAPVYAAKLKQGLLDGANALEKNFSFIPKGDLRKLIEEKSSAFPDFLAKKMPDILAWTMGLITSGIVTVFAVFFFLKDGRKMRKSLIKIVPNKYFETFLVLLFEVDQSIGAYIRGQIIDGAVVGLLSIAGLYLIGLKYGLFIGALSGAFNIVPYLGPVAAMVPAVLVATAEHHDALLAFKAVGVLALVQLIDNAVVSPLALGKSVDIHPLIVILILPIGGMLMGVWGMLLAVPLYCSLTVTFEILYKGIIKYGNWEA